MRAGVVGLVGAGVIAVGLVAAPAATASTNSAGGLSVTVPSSATAYNSGTVTVRPSVRVSAGTKKVVIARKVYAFKGSRRVASGTSVKLHAGTYKLQTKVTYKPWHYVSKTRTVTTHHEGGMPDGSSCVVTAIDDFGYGMTSASAADCTNAAFPGQVVHENDPVFNDFPDSPQVGETYASDYITFAAFDSSRQQTYQARSYGAARVYTTPKRALTVKNGGHRRVFVSSASLTTSYFSVPRGHRWTAQYAYNCNAFGYAGNWMVIRHRKGASVLTDAYLDNEIKHSGFGRYHGGSGTYRFQVITECSWQIAVYWR